MNRNFVIFVLAILVLGVGTAVYLSSDNNVAPVFPAPDTTGAFSSQEECERQTRGECRFQMCDYIPPGKTFEETCGKDFHEGWAPVP